VGGDGAGIVGRATRAVDLFLNFARRFERFAAKA